MTIKQKQLPISEATDAQIFDFVEAMQLNPTTRDRNALLGLLAPAWSNTFILVPDDSGAPATAQSEVDQLVQVQPQARQYGNETPGASDPKVELTIGYTEMPGGKDMVPVQVNGRNLILPRNVRVSIPYRFFLALEQAQRGEVSQDEKSREISEVQVTNYPLNIHRRPSDEEIARFHRETDGIELGERGLVAA